MASSFAVTGPAGPAASPESAFVRLWLGFATARVGVAVALLILLLGAGLAGTPPVSGWLVGLCGTYLAATLAVRLLARPGRPGAAFDPQWVSSIGVDLLVFACLQFVQAGGIYYAPLFAVPVLMASVLGSTSLALGTAAAVALLLLAEAWVLALQSPGDMAQRFVQGGLTGIGFFALAFLAHQLALRLEREEAAARRSRKLALMQVQVNQLVIDALAEGVLVVDPAGEVQAANPAARDLLGAPAGEQPLHLSDDPAWAPLAGMAGRTFDSRQPQLADLALEQAGAPARHMYARTRLAAAGEWPSDSLCVIFLQDLREMEARLRTEKLAAMGRMSTAVAHEIRNPLAAISQANELLEEELHDPAQRQLSALVRQNAQRLSQIVEEILDVARVQHQPIDPAQARLNLDPAVAAHCRDWATQNRAGQRLALVLAASPQQPVDFAPHHLRRILVNLLDNALRHASAAPDAIQVATTGAAQPTLTVWSDGPALEPAVERHLFEPFFSSDSRSSGLGLYICRELCGRHGARIGYRRGPAPGGDRRAGNAFFVAFRTSGTAGAHPPFAKIAV
ncbi:PAS domain-containing sensor histidine kinase [Ramlibacter tataouinensis]|uniref:sensor histidine kinase n=1 Tax=Ramlibacter tataouinensis TaxID=94132 RepID=UPI0022F38CA5|nr:PAS domain-containing sensor histidine kinase [Ramlibacter tataouinensis]WBY03740.1 PAS domain-containing sensor histidine kinase [Ramlibacter tataouinensis]